MKRIIYFSDGAAGQYKNRYNVANILNHERDFGVPAEWHYFATSHGKNTCDGLGGTLKRLADRRSLQSLSDRKEPLLSAEDLYKWACTSITGMNLEFVSEKAVQDADKRLSSRFRDAVPVPGMRSIHAVIPISETTVQLKELSTSGKSTELQIQNTSGYFEPESDDEPPSRRTR